MLTSLFREHVSGWAAAGAEHLDLKLETCHLTPRLIPALEHTDCGTVGRVGCLFKHWGGNWTLSWVLFQTEDVWDNSVVFCQRWVGCDPFDSGATWTPEEAVLHFMPQTFKPHVHSCFQYLSDVEEQWNIHKHERHHEPVFTFIRHLSAPHDLDSAARVPALTLSRCSDLRDVLIVQMQHEHTGTAADLPSHRFRSPCQELYDTQDTCCLYWLRSSQISWFHWLIQWIFVLDMD